MDRNINIFTNKGDKGKTLLLGSLLLVLALMHFCGKKSTPSINENVLKKTETKTIIRRKIFIDTITFYDSIPIYININVKTPIYDTIKRLNTYENPFEDSLIIGTIFSTVDGVLVDQKFNYIPKFPKYIIKTDSTIITNNVTNSIIVNKRRVYIGMELGGNTNSFSISPVLSFSDKKYNLFSYRYDALNKTHNIGFQKQLKFKK